MPIKVDQYTYDSPHTKTHLLLQARFSRVSLPIADYGTDTKSVLDQAIRIMQAMIDVCADEGWLSTVLQVITLIQMVVQGRWHYDSSLLMLPRVTEDLLPNFFKTRYSFFFPQNYFYFCFYCKIIFTWHDLLIIGLSP